MQKVTKLLLVGSSSGSVHLQNYYALIKGFFDDVLVLTDTKIEYEKYRIADFSINKPWKIVSKIKHVRRIIQEFNPDVIHVHQANSIAYITTKANINKIPLILTAWGSDVLVLPQRSLLFKKMVSNSLKNADVVTADAGFMIDAIATLSPKSNTVLANFGIDIEDLTCESKEKLIYSNRMHTDLYNIDKIIEGFAEFVKNNTDWKLIIGATGSRTEELKVLAENLLPKSSYLFIGFVDAKTNNDYYKRSQVWVSIPKSDGTAISLLEAMAAGCVPVLNDLPANNEWVVDGENGIIVSDSLNSALERAISLDFSEVQKKNKQIILKRGTKEVNREIFTGIYKKLLAEL